MVGDSSRDANPERGDPRPTGEASTGVVAEVPVGEAFHGAVRSVLAVVELAVVVEVEAVVEVAVVDVPRASEGESFRRSFCMVARFSSLCRSFPPRDEPNSGSEVLDGCPASPSEASTCAAFFLFFSFTLVVDPLSCPSFLPASLNRFPGSLPLKLLRRLCTPCELLDAIFIPEMKLLKKPATLVRRPEAQRPTPHAMRATSFVTRFPDQFNFSLRYDAAHS